jgi:hypothetical protein
MSADAAATPIANSAAKTIAERASTGKRRWRLRREESP